MDAAADVALSDLSTLLAHALAGCPAPLLWSELHRLLPLDGAAAVFDAAAAAAIKIQA